MEHRSTLSSDKGGQCAEHTGCRDALNLSGPGHIPPLQLQGVGLPGHRRNLENVFSNR